MELSSRIFSEVFSPLAAFIDATVPTTSSYEDSSNASDDTTPFEASLLNPKNRIDSLEWRAKSRWRLDGVDDDGQRFFAVPIFAIDAPPLRVDLFVPPVEEHPRHLREALRSNLVMRSSGRAAANLPISQHVLRGLEYWTSRTPGFASQYSAMPFGSQILLTELVINPSEMDFHMVPRHDVEQAMLSARTLQDMWNLPSSALPEIVDLSDLRYRQQIHEAITLVRIPSRHGDRDLVFKSLTRDRRHLYHELKMLLTVPPHPNLIGGPVHIVTKKCNFGGKHGVCGFILEHYPLGSLHTMLSKAAFGLVPFASGSQCFRWARQITETLIHINKQPFGFYPDLKPDNIVLRQAPTLKGDGQMDAVLLDLEQRGGWFSWSPPEIAYVEYLDILASRLESRDALRAEIARELAIYMPGWVPSTEETTYTNANGGFSFPWLALAIGGPDGALRGTLEKAQVFMLGKLLWCIFEGQPLVRCGIDHDRLKDNDQESSIRTAFPEFTRTPPGIQNLVRACTHGALEWDGQGVTVTLQEGKLTVSELCGRDRHAMGEENTEAKTQETTKRWWEAEIMRARAFIKEVTGNCEQTQGLLEKVRCRPTFAEVLAALVQLENAEVETV